MQVNTEKTELALKTASSEIKLFVDNAESEVKALEDKFASIVPDASTKDGYKHCKSVRAELLPIKSNLEGARKTLKAPILAAGKLIDGAMNPLASRIETLYKPFENAYREVDNEKKRKEEERQAKIQSAFDELNQAVFTASGSTSSVIETLIDELADFDLNPDVFMERTEEAANKHNEVMEKLGGMLLQAKQQEEFEAKQREIEQREKAIAEAEEKERQRIEAEKQAKLQVERQKQIEEEKQKAAEQARIEAEERHKRDMELAEQRAKEQAEQAAKAERERLERIAEQEKQAALAREKDRANKASVHNTIIDAISVTDITQEQAKAIVVLMAKRKVPHVQINY